MDIIQKDLQHIWHPCSQMKDYLQYPPIEVCKAQGSYYTLTNGKKIIDAISSWWCKSFGHNHPRIKEALIKQMDKFEHVIQARTTNKKIVALSEQLCTLSPDLNKVFYSTSGSNAVEIALKMSLHSRKILGQTSRKNFVSLKNGYHGETTGALSVSDVGIFKSAYSEMLFETSIIQNIAYVTGPEDPHWKNAQEFWNNTEKKLEHLSESTTAIIFEPIVQGAGGMKIISADYLKHLAKWSRKNNIHLIADEIMTGIGRTGKMLACEHADIQPDFICLGKGLTAGWLPLSAVLTSTEIYNYFYDDYETGKSFLHSETFSGNALGVAVALETLSIIEDEDILTKANSLSSIMRKLFENIANKTEKLTNIRSIGGIVAAELTPHPTKKRLGFEIALQANNLGALVRPLDNTLYWLPPLNTDIACLEELSSITEKAITLAYS